MNKREFLRRRRPIWRKFQALMESLGRRRRLTADEIRASSRLLRETSHDLATIRSRSWGQDLNSYVNGLVTRGHNRFYSAPPARLSEVWHFIAVGFPRLLRENIWYFVVAWLLFFVPLGISWAVVQNQPQLANRVLPEETLTMFDTMYDDNTVETNDSNEDSEGFNLGPGADQRSFMTGFYINHNTSIAFHCFVRGALLGIGTVYTLLFNGIVIGTVAGYVVAMGHEEKFLSFVVTHGSFELTAIAVSGAAGLILGDALIHPGKRTRLESFRVRAMDAMKLAAGAGIMLVIAAFIEGFWSPSAIPAIIKYVVGGILWMVVYLYIGCAGLRGSSK